MFRRLTTLTVSRASTTGTPVASLINAAIGGFAANQLVGVNTKKAAVSPKAKTKLSASPQKKQPVVTSKPLTKKKTLAKKKVVSTKKKASAKKKIAPKKKAAIGKKKAVAKKKSVTVKKKATTKKATKKKAVTKKKSILKKKTASKKKTIKKKALTKKKSAVKKKLAAKRKVTKKLAKKKKPLVKKKAALKKKAKTTALALVPTKATKVALIAQLDKERAARRRVERRLDSITTKYRELLAELSAIREIANNLILENKQQLADRRAKEIDAGGTPATLLPPHPAGISDDLASAPKSITSGEDNNSSSNNIESLLSDSTGVLETVEPASPEVDVVEQQDAEDDLLPSTPESPMKEEAVKPIGKETKRTDWSSPPPLKRETPSPYEQFTREVWNDEELLDQKMADFGILSDPSLQKYNKNPAEMRYHAKKKTIWRLWGERVEKSTPSAPATAPTATSRVAAARSKVTPPPMILDDFSDLLTAPSTTAQPYVEAQPEVVVAAEKTQQYNKATTQSQKTFSSAEEKKKTAVKTQSKKKEEKSSSSSVKRDRERQQEEGKLATTPEKAQMGKMNEKTASKKDTSTATSRPTGKKSQSPSIAAEKESKSSAKPKSAGGTKVLKAEKVSPKEKAQTEKKKEKAITPSSSVGTKKDDLSKEESEFKKFAQEMWMSSELSKKMKAVGSYKSSFVTSLSKEEGTDGGKEFHAKLHGMAALWKERHQRKQTKQQQSSEKSLGLDKCKKWVLTAMNEELDGAL